MGTVSEEIFQRLRANSSNRNVRYRVSAKVLNASVDDFLSEYGTRKCDAHMWIADESGAFNESDCIMYLF